MPIAYHLSAERDIKSPFIGLSNDLVFRTKGASILHKSRTLKQENRLTFCSEKIAIGNARGKEELLISVFGVMEEGMTKYDMGFTVQLLNNYFNLLPYDEQVPRSVNMYRRYKMMVNRFDARFRRVSGLTLIYVRGLTSFSCH